MKYCNGYLKWERVCMCGDKDSVERCFTVPSNLLWTLSPKKKKNLTIKKRKNPVEFSRWTNQNGVLNKGTDIIRHLQRKKIKGKKGSGNILREIWPWIAIKTQPGTNMQWNTTHPENTAGPETRVLSEVSQRGKDKSRMTAFICRI